MFYSFIFLILEPRDMSKIIYCQERQSQKQNIWVNIYNKSINDAKKVFTTDLQIIFSREWIYRSRKEHLTDLEILIWFNVMLLY